MLTNVIMNIENCITATYGLIALTYASHIVKMRYYDFLVLAILYLALSILYQIEVQYELNNDSLKLNNDSLNSDLLCISKQPLTKKYIIPDEPEEIHMKNVLSILYSICFLIYLKHQFIHTDLDYFWISLPIFTASIIKYNIMSKKGTKSLSQLEWVHFLSILGISFVFGKHGFVQDHSDYIWLTGLYALHTGTEYRLRKNEIIHK